MIVQVIDPTHPDYMCVIFKTRTMSDHHFIEYRHGGVWLRMHTSQYREMTEDDDGRIYVK